MNDIRCVLIDDERTALERMVLLLRKFPEVKIIGIEEDPGEAIEVVLEKKPEIVFVDVEMPRKSGFDVVREIRNRGGNPFFVFVTGYSQYAIKAIKAAAFDYLIKPVDIDELREMLQRYRQDYRFTQSNVAHSEVLYKDFKLSEREIEILKHITLGESSQEIADKLFLSKSTVDTHRRNIIKKTRVKNSKELISFTLRKNLIS